MYCGRSWRDGTLLTIVMQKQVQNNWWKVQCRLKRKYWHFGCLCGVITLKILNTEKYLFGRADENLHCPVTKGTIANLYSSTLLEEPHLCCCLHSEGEMLKVVISISLIFKFLQRHSELCAQVNFPMYKSWFDHTVTKYYILL